MVIHAELSPGFYPKDERLLAIKRWWAELYSDGDSGAARWDVLDELQNQVMDALGMSPPDIVRAESVTARAALIMEGSKFY